TARLRHHGGAASGHLRAARGVAAGAGFDPGPLSRLVARGGPAHPPGLRPGHSDRHTAAPQEVEMRLLVVGVLAAALSVLLTVPAGECLDLVLDSRFPFMVLKVPREGLPLPHLA